MNFFYRDLFKISLNLYRRSHRRTGAPLTPFGRGNVKMKSGPKFDMKKIAFSIGHFGGRNCRGGGHAETDCECAECCV